MQKQRASKSMRCLMPRVIRVRWHRETTVARFIQAGVIPTSTNAVLSETHRTWNRPEAAELGKLYALVAANYAAVIESYQMAQDVAKQTVGQATGAK